MHLLVTLLLVCLVEYINSANQNVLGTDLELCNDSPLTGFQRTGFCEADENDAGLHLVCAQMNDDFLEFTRSRGNDLSARSRHFPGLRAGDYWCLCVYRWYEAYAHGHAPPVFLAGTHVRTLDYLDEFNLNMSNLSQFSISRPQMNGHYNPNHTSDF